MKKTKTKDILGYLFLPRIRPRAASLFASGFQYLAYGMAMVYSMVRLLPNSHPYLDPANKGQFGVRNVIAEAANNLVLSRRNIDQIIVFGTILTGLVMLALQIVLAVFSLLLSPAMALPSSFKGFFITPDDTEAHDMAHIMMDLVFGVPKIFNSCISKADTPCLDLDGNEITTAHSGYNFDVQGVFTTLGDWPYPVHNGLHALFQFYSVGLMVIAAMVAIYFITTIVMETAQTGTAFGKRFNKVWAPIRFVVAFGLLIPIGVGFNSGQYIILYAAKFGSGFATNGWNLFYKELNTGVMNDTQTLISQPEIPEIGGLLQFMFTARTCAEAFQAWHKNVILSPTQHMGADWGDITNTPTDGVSLPENEEEGGWEMLPPDWSPPDNFVEKREETILLAPYAVGDPLSVQPYLLIPPIIGANTQELYKDFLKFAGEGGTQVTIRFGFQDAEQFAHMRGTVKPECGELTFPLAETRHPEEVDDPSKVEPGPTHMQFFYLWLIQYLWYDVFAGNFVDANSVGADYYNTNFPLYYVQSQPAVAQAIDDSLFRPHNQYGIILQDLFTQYIRYALLGHAAWGEGWDVGALEKQNKHYDGTLNDTLRKKGWAGAAIWYNRIAEMNGVMTTAIYNIPIARHYPMVMEFAANQKKAQDQNIDITERFKPKMSDGTSVSYPDDKDLLMANAMYNAYKFWEQGGTSTSFSEPTGNAFIDTINNILGTSGLFSMRKNANVHPLAQLSGIGRSLVESSMRNLGYAVVGGVSGTLLSSISNFTGSLVQAGVGMLITITMIGITIGFVLFYIIPFMPFIYFFFALGGWVKGIFEAMVAIPLWALAHIRIDGEGLPGQAAASGYYLVLEIFLRPIMILFGLLASITTFSALVSVLNDIWDLVVANVGGFDIKTELDPSSVKVFKPENFDQGSLMAFMRGPVDRFFFTVIYAIIVYIMAMASFKMIDLIPNNILRWMGQSVSTFNDQRDNPAEGLTGKATIGTQQTASSLGQGLQSLTKHKIPEA